MPINWEPKTIWTGDCLYIMRGMNSETVDLIYLDPPFNSKANYAAPIGSQAAGAAFKDTWTLTDIDVEWISLVENDHPALYRVLLAAMTGSDKSYLAYMAARLLEMRRVLKSTGSIYLHCDPTMSHYLKLVMDAVFGHASFLNEIIWHYQTGGAGKQRFSRKHDVILLYSKAKNYVFNFHDVKVSRSEKSLKRAQNQKGARISAVVLDPFCGCATTLVAADDVGRSWVGIDISPKAGDLVKRRIADRQGLWRNIVEREDIPKRTDLIIPRYKSHERRRMLYGRQEGNCAGCETHFIEARHLEVDHIISKGKGGTDHISNLQLLCPSCNRIKGNRGMEYLTMKLQIR